MRRHVRRYGVVGPDGRRRGLLFGRLTGTVTVGAETDNQCLSIFDVTAEPTPDGTEPSDEAEGDE